jgi:hypothetical protein
MYRIQETKKGDFIVRDPGDREMFKGTEEECQEWIGHKLDTLKAQAQQAANQEAFDNSIPDLNTLQIRWQKWRNWFYSNLQREGRRVNQMRRALDGTDSNLASYNSHEEKLARQQEELTEAESLYSRAVYLDSRIKTARLGKGADILSELLVQAEVMIGEMDGYFVSVARPDDAKPKQPGTKPNTSIVLTEKELAFIDEKFGGSKSAAIHEALSRLMDE